MDSANQGLGADTLTDVPVDGAPSNAAGAVPLGLTEEEAEELRTELSKVEEEIHTLRQVLVAKEKHSSELKRKLGISPLNEFKQNITKGWQDVQTSNAFLTASVTLEDISQSEVYKKTQETLSQASLKTSAALSTMGTAISKKLVDMRNSPTFKSFEDKVGNIKYKVVGGGGQSNGAGVQSPDETKPAQDDAPF